MKKASKSKRSVFMTILSIVLVITLCSSTFFIGAIETPEAAQAEVLGATVHCITPKMNEWICFNVQTNIDTTRIKIEDSQKDIYAVADINSGFTSYVDTGSTRMWTLYKKSKSDTLKAKYVYAGIGSVYNTTPILLPNATEFENVVTVKRISVNYTTISLEVNKSQTLGINIYPTNASNKMIGWTSSRPAIATVDSNGKITGHKTGNTLITASLGGLTSICAVTVYDNSITVKPTAVNVSLAKSSIYVGDTTTASASVLPATANQGVTWSVDKESVAKIDQTGKITAVAEGTATITATTTDGSNVSGTAKLTVNKKTTGEPLDLPEVPYYLYNTVYSKGGTEVYFHGKIYKNKYYASATDVPGESEVWEFVRNSTWTGVENENYYYDDSYLYNRVLSTDEILESYGELNPNFTPENCIANFKSLMSKQAYEARFPYRFGTANWAKEQATPSYYPDYKTREDYYSYDNLIQALEELSNIVIRIDVGSWGDCKRVLRLDKTTGEQQLLYRHSEFSISNSTTQIIDYGSFLNEGDLNNRKRELAAFLANTSHETGGGQIWIDGATVSENLTGFFWVEEVGYIGSSQCGYVTSGDPAYQAAEGKSYHGRGPIQCSYPFNYGQLSEVVYGDKSVLINNPEKLLDDGVLGFKSGIWFWMTPQKPKPSCHDAITGAWKPESGKANAAYNGQFGLTVIIINGEAGVAENSGTTTARRMRYYRDLCDLMGVPQDAKVDSLGMTAFN